MSTISIGIICQDNEDIIRDCLESAKWADEIVVVDAFSKDKTLEICREYTDKIYQHKVDSHLNEQWNRTIEYATCNWVFSLSTDQRFTPQLRDEIKAVIEREDGKVGYYVPLENYFLGKWIQHCGWSPDYNILFFKKDKGIYSDRENGILMIEGELGYLKSRLIHYSHTDIYKTLEKINMTSTREAEYFLQARPPFKRRFILTKALRNFRKTYWKKQGYKDGMHGLAFCLLFSFNKFLIYAKYWEMLQNKKGKVCSVHEDLKQATEKQNCYSSAQAERMFEEHGLAGEKEMKYRMTIMPLKLFCKSYIQRLGFRKGIRGLIDCIFNSYSYILTWSKYWELCYVKKVKSKS